MKNIKGAILFFGGVIAVIITTLALAINYFGWQNVEVVLWALTTAAAYALGRYHTGRDMIRGAKVVLASQESDDRRERASMSTLSQFIGGLRGSGKVVQPALTAGPQGDGYATNIPADDLIFEDGDFTFDNEDE